MLKKILRSIHNIIHPNHMTTVFTVQDNDIAKKMTLFSLFLVVSGILTMLYDPNEIAGSFSLVSLGIFSILSGLIVFSFVLGAIKNKDIVFYSVTIALLGRVVGLVWEFILLMMNHDVEPSPSRFLTGIILWIAIWYIFQALWFNFPKDIFLREKKGTADLSQDPKKDPD